MAKTASETADKADKKKKKAAADLEAFEKELDEDVPTGKHLDDLDDEDLGEDVFAQGSGSVSGSQEAWLSSDRDYTYDEVGCSFFQQIPCSSSPVALETFLRTSTLSKSCHASNWQAIDDSPSVDSKRRK